LRQVLGFKVSAWIYIFDEFKPLDLDLATILELVNTDPLKLFAIIREVVEDYVKDIENVKVHKVFSDPHNFELLVEYIVRCRLGEISVKLIYSKNPAETLRKYYNVEGLL